MGELNINEAQGESERRAFMKALLEEARALESMLPTALFERGIRRIGAEQEMFLVDSASQAHGTALQVLERINDERFTHELALFNMECNLSPQVLGGDCLRRMEDELIGLLARAREAAAELGSRIVLTGILPTLKRSDLGLDSMVPMARYHQLNETLLKMRGSDFQFDIKGIDHLQLTHPNLMLEACNTSFQVHFQVEPGEFANLYNVAQAVTAPLMSVCVNSPILLRKRLWHETRIAVFEHSVDTRSEIFQERGQLPRVHFGDDWINESVIEIFKEDIARFRVVLTCDVEKDPADMVKRGIAPQFKALRLHNGTVYRWNRACYGVADGVAHLRIENRIIPSGPTVLDELANASFFFGLMSGLAEAVDDIREVMSFEDARTNFFRAARDGLKAEFTWINGESFTAVDLISQKLLPLARAGLERLGIDDRDINRYLGVIEARTTTGRTGARWSLESVKSMAGSGSEDERCRQLVKSMLEQEATGVPVHKWELAHFDRRQDWRDSYKTVGLFMTTDLFTVRPDDLVDFAASLMEWKHVRHVPVEDDAGRLVGLVSHRSLLRMIARGGEENSDGAPVRDIMAPEPVTVVPETPTVDAIRLMRDQNLGCLLVVREDKLVGIVTERDLLNVAANLLEDHLRDH